MTVHEFKRPELSDEIKTAREQLAAAKESLDLFSEQYHSIQAVHDALKPSVSPGVSLFLLDELEGLKECVDETREAMETWQAVLEALIKKSAAP